MTYYVLLDQSKQLVVQSNIRPADDPMFPNQALWKPPPGGDTSKVINKPVVESITDGYGTAVHLLLFPPEELLGCTFLYQTPENGEVCAKVVRKIIDADAEQHQNLKFLLSLGDGQLEHIIAYNE